MANFPKGNASAGSLLAEMYALWTLDCIVDVAHAVALDFVSRPRHYRHVSDDVANVLARFKALTGNHTEWPDAIQRAAVFDAVLGSSDGKAGGDRSTQFHVASAALRAAATSFSERVYDSGVAMLRQRFRDTVITLRAYLNTLEGRAVTLGHSQTSAIFEHATQVLTSEEVGRVFGLPPAPGGDWPLAGTYGGDGAYLIEEITRVLQPANTGPTTERQFIVMQRIAHYGHQTIMGVLDASDGWEADDRIDKLIQDAYSWLSALQDLSK